MSVSKASSHRDNIHATNYSLRNLRVLSTFMVICLHTPMMRDQNLSYLVQPFLITAVPIFFTLSGGVNLKASVLDTGNFYSKKIKRVLIPLVIWTALHLMFSLLMSSISFEDIPGIILKGRPSVHLWFLYSLAMMFVVTPVIYKGIRKLSIYQLYLLWGSIQIAITVSYLLNFRPHYFFIEFLQYLNFYILGYLLIQREQYKRLTSFTYLFILLGAIAITYISDHSLAVPNRLSITTLLATFGVTGLFLSIESKKSAILAFLDKMSFGIYLVHIFVLLLVYQIPVLSEIPVSVFNMILISSFTFCLSCLVCYGISKIHYFRVAIGLFAPKGS